MLRHWLLERAAEQRRQSHATGNSDPRERSMVFVSYSHKDEGEKDALLTHLRVLQDGAEMVEVWCDDEIGGGQAWEAAVDKAVSRAKVAILLVTANFLSSNFILKKEVPALLRRREREGVRMIPVIAKSCAWRKVAWLAEMNVRPKNGRAIWGRDESASDDALAAIAEEVAMIVAEGRDAQD